MRILICDNDAKACSKLKEELPRQSSIQVGKRIRED